MEYTINAKPTIYKNTRFRSRLEARWAVFFDLIGWRWQYECNDFIGWTPDFTVYGSDGRYILFEVKPFLDSTILKEYQLKIENAMRPLPATIDCILLDNNFEEDKSYGGLFAGIKIGWKVHVFDSGIPFEFVEPHPVHWKDGQTGVNSEFDIGSLYYSYNGILWNDHDNRKAFVCDGKDATKIKALWVKAGVLSSFHYE